MSVHYETCPATWGKDCNCPCGPDAEQQAHHVTPAGPEAGVDVEQRITVVCDLLWSHGIYLPDSTPLARAIVAALEPRS